ncbi:MAG TPA: type II toxin-antitoxin system MqsA family antitoxin [Ramlibacter sp.]|nr:type II toxin-antitoxin system MqsA family antitoxin [Ramlibacter sp.]
MDTKELCPICGEGHVTAHVDQVESEYKGQKAWVPLHFKLCDACGSDFAGADESRLNKRAVLAFRKSVDGLLTGVEIRALRDKYQLTQGQAAKLFGGGPVAFSKYENDDVAHSEAMDSLLRLVNRSAVAFWELVVEKGMATEFAVDRSVTLTSTTTNVILMAGYRAGPPRGPQRTRLLPYSTETKKWK